MLKPRPQTSPPFRSGGSTRLRSGQLDRLRGVHLMGGMERYLGRDRDAELGHGGAQAIVAESVEGILALPRVDVVAVLPFPPRQVGDAAGGRTLEPANVGSDCVVLLARDPAQNQMDRDSHICLPTRTIAWAPARASGRLPNWPPLTILIL